jgi:uncharacterized phage protein (TIGR02216 family)
MKPFPWDEAMRFGFGVMHLSSREFWGLSPRELAAAFTATSGRSAPPSRARLDELMGRFPDKENRHG